MTTRMLFGAAVCTAVFTCSCIRTIAVKPIEIKPVRVESKAADGKGGVIAEANPTPTPLDGIVFYLPKTVLDVTVETKVEKAVPGLYCQYQRLFFSDEVKGVDCPKGWKSDIAQLDKVIPPKASVAGVTMASRGVPDTSRPFIVPIGGASVDTSDTFEFKENGILSGAESSRADRKLDLGLSLLKFGAGLAGRFIGGAGSGIPAEKQFCGKAKKGAAEEKDKLVLFACQLMGMDHAAATGVWLNLRRLDEAQVRDLLENEWKDCTDELCSNKSVSDRPWLLLQARDRYLDYKTLLEVRPGSTADGIKAGQEKAQSFLESYFTGKKTSPPWVPVFEVTPGKLAQGAAAQKSYPLFRKGNGCFWPNAPTSEVVLRQTPLPAALKCAQEPGDGTQVSLQIEKTRGTGYEQLSEVFKRHFTQPASASYPFNIPLEVNLSLDGGACPECNDLLPAKLMLAQWGEQYALPVGTASKSKNIKVSYFEATGALKTVTIGSNAFDASGLVGGISDATSGILDAKKKAVEEEESSELRALTKQRMLLEEKSKIADFCKKLELTCN